MSSPARPIVLHRGTGRNVAIDALIGTANVSIVASDRMREVPSLVTAIDPRERRAIVERIHAAGGSIAALEIAGDAIARRTTFGERSSGINRMTSNQTPAVGIVIPALGTVAVGTLTLAPVVAGVYMPQQTTVANTVVAQAGSFETTVFATDARGFVIQNQAGVVNGDNRPLISITPTGLTMNSFNSAIATYTTLAATSTSNTAPPIVGTLSPVNPLTINPTGAISASNYLNVFGILYTNVLTPSSSQPYTAALTAAATNAAGGAGNPINVVCVAPANPAAGFTVTLRSQFDPTVVATAPVFGYTYILGTNYPSTTATTLANAVSTSTTPTGRSSNFLQAGTLTGINCNPSITLPIN